jgi:hypothetical protein
VFRTFAPGKLEPSGWFAPDCAGDCQHSAWCMYCPCSCQNLNGIEMPPDHCRTCTRCPSTSYSRIKISDVFWTTASPLPSCDVALAAAALITRLEIRPLQVCPSTCLNSPQAWMPARSVSAPPRSRPELLWSRRRATSAKASLNNTCRVQPTPSFIRKVTTLPNLKVICPCYQGVVSHTL